MSTSSSNYESVGGVHACGTQSYCVSFVSLTGLVVMIIVNNIEATPLVITMVEVTMVTTIMVEVVVVVVVAVDHLIGGTELTSDRSLELIFSVLFYLQYIA